jgi:putative ABC transport system permease protein
MFNWKYFDEANDYIKGRSNWYVLDLDDPSRPPRSPRRSTRSTTTRTTKPRPDANRLQPGVRQAVRDIGLIVTAIMSAVFFTLLLLTGNTMAQAVRERIPELAVLKTIGFSNGSVLWLVLVESVLLIVIGGAIGLGLASVLMPAISSASNGVVNLSAVPIPTWVLGIGLMIAIGFIVGAPPALRAMRLSIVDALAGR